MNRKYIIPALITAAIVLASQSFADSLQQCMDYRMAGRFKDAVRAGERAAVENPGDIGAWYCLGDSWGHMGRLPQALSALANALRVAGGDYDKMRIYYRIGDLLRNDERQYEASVEAWTQSAALAARLKDDKVRSVSLFQLAVTHESGGATDKAITAYEELLGALGSDYRRSYVYNNLAGLYIRKKQPEKAVGLLVKAIDDDKAVQDKDNERRHRLNLGYAKWKTGQRKEGLADMIRALNEEATGPKDFFWIATGHRYLAAAYSETGNYRMIKVHSDAAKKYFAELQKREIPVAANTEQSTRKGKRK